MTAKDKDKTEQKHDLRNGLPPTSISSTQVHSVLDSGRRPSHDGNRLATPEADESHMPEGQDVV